MQKDLLQELDNELDNQMVNKTPSLKSNNKNKKNHS